MTGPKLTEGQRKALMWLPGDGAMVFKFGRMRSACDSLYLLTSGLVERVYSRKKRTLRSQYKTVNGYRLTPAGIEARRAGEETYRALSADEGKLPQLGGGDGG